MRARTASELNTAIAETVYHFEAFARAAHDPARREDMRVHKQDLLNINGFDTRYQAPGKGEDSDIELRLGWKGVCVRPFCHAAIQYHLYHPLLNRPEGNEELYQSVIKSGKAWTDFGLEQMKVP